MDLTTLIAGPLGGILGLAGSLVQKWMGMREAKQNHAMRMAELELASRIDLQKADINLRQTVEDRAGEAFSKAVDAQSGLRAAHPWAKTFIALFRPGLTLALWISAMILAVVFRDSQPELMNYIVTSTFSMFTVSAGYWFGVRSQEKIQIHRV